MIIHLSEHRYMQILKEGKGSWLKMPTATGVPFYIDQNDPATHYHLLQKDEGFCQRCDRETESIRVTSQAELDRERLHAALHKVSVLP